MSNFDRLQKEQDKDIGCFGWSILIMVIGVVLLSLLGKGIGIIEKAGEGSLSLDRCQGACQDVDCEFASYLEKTDSCFCIRNGNITQLY